MYRYIPPVPCGVPARLPYGSSRCPTLSCLWPWCSCCPFAPKWWSVCVLVIRSRVSMASQEPCLQRNTGHSCEKTLLICIFDHGPVLGNAVSWCPWKPERSDLASHVLLPFASQCGFQSGFLRRGGSAVNEQRVWSFCLSRRNTPFLACIYTAASLCSSSGCCWVCPRC